MTSVTTVMLVLASSLTVSMTPLSSAVWLSATPMPIDERTDPKVGATAWSCPLTSAASVPAPKPRGRAPRGAPPTTVWVGATATAVVVVAASSTSSAWAGGRSAVRVRVLDSWVSAMAVTPFTGYALAPGADDKGVRLRPLGDVRAGDGEIPGAGGKPGDVDHLDRVRTVGGAGRGGRAGLVVAPY